MFYYVTMPKTVILCYNVRFYSQAQELIDYPPSFEDTIDSLKCLSSYMPQAWKKEVAFNL